jgi:hypothetical protein
MPVSVMKQVPVKKPMPVAKAGSLLSKAVPISNLVDDYVHLLLYGRNGIGKTTLLQEFPKPMLVIAVEPSKTGGSRSIRRSPDTNSLVYGKHFKSVAEFEKIGHELKATVPYETVAVDSGSSLDEIVLAEVLGYSETINMNRWGKVTQDQYTERSEIMRRILRPYIDYPKNLVIICNEKDHNSQEGKRNALVKEAQAQSYFAAAMGGGTTRWTQDACDFICQMYMENEVIRVKKTKKVAVPGGKPRDEVYYEDEETGKFIRRLRMAYHPTTLPGVEERRPERFRTTSKRKHPRRCTTSS